ncbi:Hpt domain-containing protein [Maridesulfovibrio salexigens]|uniref:Hpt protein n=1 Tax=Maridesulfovibrio salexigens (strain ATCC 14822 / DSM 2638 / NCIMB 8403 / VKM B-1763) TaxID=526222 RepID=C6BSM2_MARSD|nr:Hpt domain-containing protein [Maridesulfovibrio salexigens]ACS81478.1 Hpt protein [Maridesulfovibrio salexigens DSM 2638]
MNLTDAPERFDLQSALDRFSGDHELLEEAIEIFVEEAAKHLEAIKTNIEQGNLKEASASSHTLKSECGAVGAIQAHSLSHTLEKGAANGDMEEALEIYPQLKKEVELAIKLLPEASSQLKF